MPFQTFNSAGTLKVTSPTTSLTSTATGSQNNWAPGIGSDTLINWSGASDLTVTGFASGGTGKRITFINTGTSVAYFSHQSGSSSAGNKLRNFVTGSTTPVAARGAAVWEYDGTDWRLISHTQGAWIAVPFSAGNFTANGSMTWTVGSGDQTTFVYKVVDTTLCVRAYLDSTTVGGVANSILQVAIPNSYTALRTMQGLALAFDNGTGTTSYNRVLASGTIIQVGRGDAANWALSTDNTFIRVNFDFEIT